MGTVHVVAVITAKQGMRKKILEAFDRNSPIVRQEQGCIEYVATIDTVDAGGLQTKFGDDTFVVVEKWKSLNALKDHAESIHMATYAKQVQDFIANRVVHVLSPTISVTS